LKHQKDFSRASNVGLSEAARISALISDLQRTDQIIEADIAREEAEAGRFELSSAAYPIIARILRVRRNNLAKTMALLEARLASVLERTEVFSQRSIRASDE
jgi:hypothetical protein